MHILIIIIFIFNNKMYGRLKEKKLTDQDMNLTCENLK